MLKKDFFLAAMAAEEYKRAAWVISAFSLIKEDPEHWKIDNYPFRVVQLPTGHWFVSPTDKDTLVQISDAKAGEPILDFHEHLELKAKEIPNLKKAITTSYGNVLVNYVGLIYPFGEKLEFLEGKISAAQIENLIVRRLKDTPKPDAKRDDKDIYVDEYLRFCDAMFYLTNFTQLCVPAGSRKSMTVSPDILPLRAKLIEENKDRLHDPAVIAKIDATLIAADKAWIKGDDAEKFLLSGKAYNVVRKKLFLQIGGEMGFGEGQDIEYIPRSLKEGWDITKFPILNNSLRASSFNRGAETQLGGESVKWLLRASSNMAVTKDDCGSKMGNEFLITDQKDNWIGFSVVAPAGSLKLTEENIGEYLGKKVTLRSPMYCKLDKTDFCKVCVGDRLAANPTALSAAVAEYGSAFLQLFLALAHGKTLALVKMDYQSAIF